MALQYLTVPQRNARKNECVRGHPFSKENTAWFKNPTHGGMMRQCRQCGIDRKRAKRAEAARLKPPKPQKLSKAQKFEQMREALHTIMCNTEPNAIPHKDYKHLAHNIYECAVAGLADTVHQQSTVEK